MTAPSRRTFLTAASGIALPIPFLASLSPGCEREPDRPHPLIVVRAASGVAQRDGEAPELFWPRKVGPLTRAILAEDNADRAISELAAYAHRLLLVRGTRFPFAATRELHAGGGNQLLTGAKCGPLTDTVMTYAMGESIDNWIARHSDVNGGEPLTLYAGRRDNYGEEVLSYRGPGQLRAADSDPWATYQRMIGASGGPALRGSVNDLVLDQLDALAANPRISAADVALLEQHTDSVRDFEVVCGRVADDSAQAMADLAGMSAVDEVSLDVARLHCDLIALVLGCEQARAVTLQIGDRLDRCRYVVNGFTLPSYHELTHGLVSQGSLGPYASTVYMHADVNRLHLQVFRYLLDRLAENGVLSTAVAVFTSDVSTGSHRYDQIPWVIAGGGDGSLRSGEYVDAGDQSHHRLLATLLTATGHRTADGDPITQFGDPVLNPGLNQKMLRD
jgi:hypothetical protein